MGGRRGGSAELQRHRQYVSTSDLHLPQQEGCSSLRPALPGSQDSPSPQSLLWWVAHVPTLELSARGQGPASCGEGGALSETQRLVSPALDLRYQTAKWPKHHSLVVLNKYVLSFQVRKF